MPCTVAIGGFFGDEGKGKIIAYLARKDNPSIAVRGGVGPNAGHTFSFENKTYKLRMLSSAVVNPLTRLLIGAGVLIDKEILLNEIKMFNTHDRTFVDSHCGIIEKIHIEKDNSEDHLKCKIGTTVTGTGPANADRALRVLKIAREVRELLLYVEGTQGTFLSLFHGDYPYVTSKDVCASAICSDIGIGPKKVDDVIVVFKAYVTRVGGGPLYNEISIEEAHRRGWAEFGSVTGRQRRASPFNMDFAKKAISLNSATQLAVTKLDVIFPESARIKEFAKLQTEPRKFIENIEQETGKKVTLIGTGADVNDVIDRRDSSF